MKLRRGRLMNLSGSESCSKDSQTELCSLLVCDCSLSLCGLPGFLSLCGAFLIEIILMKRSLLALAAISHECPILLWWSVTQLPGRLYQMPWIQCCSVCVF